MLKNAEKEWRIALALAFMCFSVCAQTVVREWRAAFDYSAIDPSSLRCMSEPYGAPALPEETVLVDVPKGAEFQDLSFHVDEWTDMNLSAAPQAIQQPWRSDSKPVATLPDAKYFGCDAWPPSPVVNGGIVTTRGEKKLRLHVRPYRWRGGSWTNTSTGRIEVVRGLSVSVAFKLRSMMKAMSVAHHDPCNRTLTIISPPDLLDAWNYYAEERRKVRDHWDIAVVGTDAIYEAHPFGDGEDCRNPAESIHAYIRSAASQGVAHILLGGVWMDAGNTNKTYSLATGEIVTLSNAVPGVCASPYLQQGCEPIPCDLYYACLDDPSNGIPHPWDSNGNGIYLERDEAISSNTNSCDFMPDIAVGRFMPMPFAVGGSRVFSQSEIITNYAWKVAHTEKFSWRENAFNIGLISGELRGSYGVNGTSLGRPRREFYFFDGLANTWSAEHPATVTDAAMETREILRSEIAPNWPVANVGSLHVDSEIFKPKYESVAEARNDLLRDDYCYTICRTHGSQTYVASALLTREMYARSTGITLFQDFAIPCHAGKIDYSTSTVSGTIRLSPSLGVASTSALQGGACAGIFNTSYGWMREFSGISLSDGLSSTLCLETTRSVFRDRAETFGLAFLAARRKYVEGNNIGGVELFTLCEQFYLGDPSLSLPSVERDVGPNKAITGATRCVNAVVSVENAENWPTYGNVRVMKNLYCNGTNLTVRSSGGIGGCVAFTDSRPGRLTLDDVFDFYVGGVSNCAAVHVNGTENVIDVTGADSELNHLFFEGGRFYRPENVLRCTKANGLTNVFPICVRDSTLRLETGKAFGVSDKPTAVVSNGALLFAESPNKGWPVYDLEELTGEVHLHCSELFAEKKICFGRKLNSEYVPVDLRVSHDVFLISDETLELCGTNFITLASGARLYLEAALTNSNAGALVVRGPGRMIITGKEMCADLIRVTDGATLEVWHPPLACKSLVVESGAVLYSPATSPLRHDVVSMPGTLVVDDGARVVDAGGQTIEGVVIGGSFFEQGGVLHWKGGVGEWSDQTGWRDAVTGEIGAWLPGALAVFDAAEGSLVTNDLSGVNVGGLLFASDTHLCGNGLSVESGEFNIPTNVTATLALGVNLAGDVTKFGDGALVLHGEQAALSNCCLWVRKGTLAFSDVTAPGVTNLSTDAGTRLGLAGNSSLTNAVSFRTMETNSLVLAVGVSSAELELGGFIPKSGFVLPRGVRLVVSPKGETKFASWNAVIDGMLDYRGKMAMSYGSLRGSGTVRVEGLVSNSPAGAGFGECRLELAGRDGMFQIYEDCSWNQNGIFVFNGTTIVPQSDLELTSADYPGSKVLMYVDEGGVCFDVPSGRTLTFGSGLPLYAFGGPGPLVKRGVGRLRFDGTRDCHMGTTYLDGGVLECTYGLEWYYVNDGYPYTFDVRISSGAVLDMAKNPEESVLLLTNLVMEAGAEVNLAVSRYGSDIIEMIDGASHSFPSRGVARFDVTVDGDAPSGDYELFYLYPLDWTVYLGTEWTLRTKGGMQACLLTDAIGSTLGVRVRPPATILLLR